MRWKEKKHRWQVRKAQKGQKKKKESGSSSTNENGHVVKSKDGRKYYKTRKIESFSIIKNTEETYLYFNEIIDEINQKNFKETFYFDLSEVKNLSVDAVMYILAILRNIKDSLVYKYDFKGNAPFNHKANEILRKSGFFDYVKTRRPILVTDGENVKIKSGNTVDSNIARFVCDYINKKCNTKKFFTGELYELLIELMTNTVQHAYKDKNVLTTNQWYIYVGDNELDFEFVFLDTGVGIPQTISKRLKEKAKEILFKINGDSFYLKSALKGEWRTRTEADHRGKGLPSIVEYTKRVEVSECKLFSGYGMCEIDSKKREKLIEHEFENKLFGTLIYWKIEKNKIGEQYYERNSN